MTRRRLIVGGLVGAISFGCSSGSEAEAERTVPEPVVSEALPPLDGVVQTTSSGDPVIFEVPFSSDDAGEPILGRLFLDYGSDWSELLASLELAPGQIEEERLMQIPWANNRSVEPGCHTITMTITHQDNYSHETLAPLDPELSAFVTWNIVHDLPLEDAPADCFSSGE